MSAPLYRGLDRAALDRAYSPSSMIEDIEVYLLAYRERSAAARAALPRARLGLRYGPGRDQTLDLFPAASADAPLHVFVHGGYWQALSKDESAFAAPSFVRAGIGFAALNYRLAPAATLEEMVEECRAAVAWLAAETGAPRIALSGHSAGAHLAAMLLATGGPPVAGALLVSGIYDLEPIALSYVNEPLGLDTEAARRLSPLFLAPRIECPVAVAWAERDTDEFRRQSAEFAEAWRGRGVDIATLDQPGRNHFDLILDLAQPQSALFGLARRQALG